MTSVPYDGTNFQVSTDGGSSWTIVTPEDPPYDDQTTSNTCMGTTPCWNGTTVGNMWRLYTMPIGQFMGEVPVFRFLFGTDGSVIYPGFFFDDMSIEGLGSAEGIPLPVTNLTGTSAGNNAILNWTDPTHDMAGNVITPTGVEVWLGDTRTGTLLETVAAGAQTYTHVNAPSGHNVYSVRAVFEGNVSSPASITVTVGNADIFR